MTHFDNNTTISKIIKKTQKTEKYNCRNVSHSLTEELRSLTVEKRLNFIIDRD